MNDASSITPEQALASGGALRAFIVRFALILLVMALLPLIPSWDGWVDSYMRGFAILVNGLLHLIGEPTQVADHNVFSEAFRVTLTPDCSALDIVVLFSATVLAFPTNLTRKLIGIVIGFICISILNIVRIVTVYLVGARWPAYVEGMHQAWWPVLLIMATLALCVSWLYWMDRRRAK